MATYGPTAAQWRVGNNAGSRFSSLGRKVAELLDLVVGHWTCNVARGRTAASVKGKEACVLGGEAAWHPSPLLGA